MKQTINYYQKIQDLLNSIPLDTRYDVVIDENGDPSDDAYSLTFLFNDRTFYYKSWLLADQFSIEGIFPETDGSLHFPIEDNSLKDFYQDLKRAYLKDKK